MTKERVEELTKLIAGVNRSEVHRTTGLSLSGVSRILSGGRVPRSPNLQAVALAVGVSMEELLDYITITRNKSARRKSRTAAA